VQAVRRNKETMMKFFMMNNYMSLRGGWFSRRHLHLRASAGEQSHI
jgi:hypothetical protein